MSTPSPDQFLMGGGVPSAKFERINDSVVGTITDQEVRQQTDLDTNKPLFWDDGRPRMQLVVTLQTDLRDDGDDDGLRRLYVKGKSLTDAVREAVRLAGARGLETGGRLKVAYVGDGVPSKKGFTAPKLYLAEYARPSQQAATEFLNGGGQQPQQGYQQPAAPQGYPQQPQGGYQPQQGYQPASGSSSGGFGQQQPDARPPF